MLITFTVAFMYDASKPIINNRKPGIMKMINKFLYAFLAVCFIIGFATPDAGAQERGNEEARTSPNASVSQTIGTTVVTITYGRPSVNGRTIFGDLVPFDRWWRTGANESTAITFSDDVMIKGEAVEAGTYSLYTVPGKEEWTIILNSKLSWGTEYDESQDVLRVKAEPQSAKPMEQLMIYFQNVTDTSAEVVIHWDETKVPFTIEV